MRIGPMMEKAIVHLGEHNGVSPSRSELAEIIAPAWGTPFGLKVVTRLVNHRLVRIDPSHPASDPKGRGAVVLTPTGEHYYWALAGDSIGV